MAENTQNVYDAAVVPLGSFPNLRADRSMQKPLDEILSALKVYAHQHPEDRGVVDFVSRIASMENYAIHDGSTAGDCSGHHRHDLREIELPAGFFRDQGGTGRYQGVDGAMHDATLARAVIHELAHATGIDRRVTPLTVVMHDRLHPIEVEIDHQLHDAREHGTPMQQASMGRFPERAAHEAGAVAVENEVMRSVFDDRHDRLNYGDRGESRTSEALQGWYREGYPMQGACSNGQPLQLERGETQAASALAPYLAPQLDGMTQGQKGLVMAQIESRLASVNHQNGDQLTEQDQDAGSGRSI